MANDSSATVRHNTPHVTRTNTIMNALKQRAQAVLNDKSIDPQSRAIIRYALETNDPWLARLVRRADAGEDLIAAIDSQKLENDEDHSSEEKIGALAEIICRVGAKSAAALFLLMGIIENSTYPNVLANVAKDAAFTHCGELSDLLASMS